MVWSAGPWLLPTAPDVFLLLASAGHPLPPEPRQQDFRVPGRWLRHLARPWEGSSCCELPDLDQDMCDLGPYLVAAHWAASCFEAHLIIILPFLSGSAEARGEEQERDERGPLVFVIPLLTPTSRRETARHRRWDSCGGPEERLEPLEVQLQRNGRVCSVLYSCSGF
jgi:hypothetical protein